MNRWPQEHIERIHRKVREAQGLGEFWRGMFDEALTQLTAEKRMADKYGVALMMIREGVQEPEVLAERVLDEMSTFTALTKEDG